MAPLPSTVLLLSLAACFAASPESAFAPDHPLRRAPVLIERDDGVPAAPQESTYHGRRQIIWRTALSLAATNGMDLEGAEAQRRE